MLKTEEMRKVLIAGADSNLKKVITLLYKFGVVHIVEHKGTDELDIGSPLSNSERLSKIVVDLRAVLTHLSIDKNKVVKHSKESVNITDINKNVNILSKRIGDIEEEITKINSKIKENNQLMIEILPLRKLDISEELFTDYKNLASFLGTLTKPKGFITEINKITTRYELIDVEEDNKVYFALFVENAFASQVSNSLLHHGFIAINIDKYKEEKLSQNNIFDKASSEINKVSEQKVRLLREIERLKEKWEDYLIISERFLSGEIEKAQAPLKFAKTKNSFLITGWIPQSNFDVVAQRLRKGTQDKLLIESMPIFPDENVPIKFKNPKIVKPFEFFMNLYSLPSYHELDPTFFVFLSFPVFFGFMLGDIGYGLVTLVLFLLLKRKMKKIAGFFNILILSSLATIIFGAIFGEFFGAEEIFGVHIPRLISRNPGHHLEPLMIMAIFFGVVHVNVGLVIGFINELKEHGKVKAILAKGGWIVLELGIALLALSYFKILPISNVLGYIFVVLSILMLFKGEGARGIVEIPGLFGNILSYLRLMAIGLSSVGLAIVINQLAEGFFDRPGLLSIIGVIILVVGHVLNIGIGILGSFLHSLRLHYVEFFTKFYKGGGIHYHPFGVRNPPD